MPWAQHLREDILLLRMPPELTSAWDCRPYLKAGWEQASRFGLLIRRMTTSIIFKSRRGSNNAMKFLDLFPTSCFIRGLIDALWVTDFTQKPSNIKRGDQSLPDRYYDGLSFHAYPHSPRLDAPHMVRARHSIPSARFTRRLCPLCHPPSRGCISTSARVS